MISVLLLCGVISSLVTQGEGAVIVQFLAMEMASAVVHTMEKSISAGGVEGVVLSCANLSL